MRALCEPRASRRWLVPFGVGALFGLCALLKPPLGGGILVCGAYVLTREQAEVLARIMEQWEWIRRSED